MERAGAVGLCEGNPQYFQVLREVGLHGGRVRRSNWWRKTLADPRGVVMEESKSHQAMKLEDTSDEEGTAQHAHHKGNFRGME